MGFRLVKGGIVASQEIIHSRNAIADELAGQTHLLHNLRHPFCIGLVIWQSQSSHHLRD